MIKELDKNKVVLGLSGGVDSAVSVRLLQEEGYEVIGACLKMCQPENEISDAQAVAGALGIEFYAVDMHERFKRFVLDDFADNYVSGRTPNPCLKCNPKVKWYGLLSLADELGAYYVATGHYARIERGEDGTCFIAESECGKDQSYALYGLTAAQIKRTIFPLGALSKEKVRELAAANGILVAHKKDSQDICFVPDGDYVRFLSECYGVKDVPGNFVTSSGKILGAHKGISHYTVGQRRGLGIAAEQSLYVLCIRPETGEVVLGFEDELYRNSLNCRNINVLISELPDNFSIFCKIRYNHRGECGKITKLSEDEIRCDFDHPVKGIAPGQAAVFYKDGCIIAGGTII